MLTLEKRLIYLACYFALELGFNNGGISATFALRLLSP